MKKAFGLVLILVLTFSSLKAQSAVLTNSEVRNLVAKQVTENYKKYTDAQVSIEVVGLPFKDLYIPNGKITVEVKPSMDKFLARDLEKASIFVNGKLVKSFNAPIVAKAYQNVLVASCFINREKAINSDVVTVKKMEISNTLEYPLREDALGKDILAKKTFREGEVIDKRFVKIRPDILRNANVTVFFSSNDLTISIEGTSLSDGVNGDTICIMNKNYNKVYTGKIIGENKVLVKI